MGLLMVRSVFFGLDFLGPNLTESDRCPGLLTSHYKTLNEMHLNDEYEINLDDSKEISHGLKLQHWIKIKFIFSWVAA